MCISISVSLIAISLRAYGLTAAVLKKDCQTMIQLNNDIFDQTTDIV